MFVSSYVLAFTVFGKAHTLYNFIIEILPVLGMMISTVACRTRNAATVRKLSLINSPLWLVYDALTHSVGGTLCEVMCLISIVIGIVRLDIKKIKKES